MIKTKDHLGNEFSSIKEMCNAYGIRQATFKHRIEKGWSVERALTEKPEKEKYQIKGADGRIVDHNGREYKSVREMCEANGIDRNSLYNDMKCGCTLREALENNERKNRDNVKVQDHNGKTFSNVAEMCKYYGIDKEAYRYRREVLNLSTAEVLEPDRTVSMHCIDHKGNDYKNLDEMCKAYGVSTDIYKMRIRNGWSLENALSKGGRINE